MAEALEIGVGQQPRLVVGDVVAAPPRRPDGERRRRLAGMAFVGAGRVDDEGVGKARSADQGREHTLGHGRAADIAGADEKDADGHGSPP